MSSRVSPGVFLGISQLAFAATSAAAPLAITSTGLPSDAGTLGFILLGQSVGAASARAAIAEADLLNDCTPARRWATSSAALGLAISVILLPFSGLTVPAVVMLAAGPSTTVAYTARCYLQRDQPAKVAITDLLWLLCVALLVLVQPSPTGAAVGWALGSLVSACFSWLAVEHHSRLQRAQLDLDLSAPHIQIPSLRQRAGLGVDNVLGSIVMLVSIAALIALRPGGTAAAGSLRAAQLLTTPANLVAGAYRTNILREIGSRATFLPGKIEWAIFAALATTLVLAKSYDQAGLTIGRTAVELALPALPSFIALQVAARLQWSWTIQLRGSGNDLVSNAVRLAATASAVAASILGIVLNTSLPVLLVWPLVPTALFAGLAAFLVTQGQRPNGRRMPAAHAPGGKL